MTIQEYLILTFFDEFEFKVLDNNSLTPKMKANEIRTHGDSDDAYWNIIHRFTISKFLSSQPVKVNIGNSAKQITVNGYKLTVQGIEAIEEEIKIKSNLKKSAEICNTILEYACEKGANMQIDNKIYRDLIIRKDLFEGAVVKLSKDGYINRNMHGFSVSVYGCLFYNDGGYTEPNQNAPTVFNEAIIDKYLQVLLLKSQTNLKRGTDQELIQQLTELGKYDVQNIFHYLMQKQLISDKGTFGNAIALTGSGLDYVISIRKGKRFKLIQFIRAEYLPPAARLVFGYRYHYKLINEDSSVEIKIIDAFASDILTMAWQLTWNGKGTHDAEKILLQFAKNKVIEKLKEGSLNDYEEIILMSSNQPALLPYNAELLPLTKDAEYEIEIVTNPLITEIRNEINQDQPLTIMEARNEPFSIIELRDEINALFREKFGANLLLLNEERSLLNFFKQAKNIEEFFYRLSSLSELSKTLNMEILRKLTNNESDNEKPSISLLEEFLKLRNVTSNDIIDILRNLSKVRQAFPTHRDNERVIKGLNYFNLKYPIREYNNTWQTLLSAYLKSLNQLSDLLTHIPAEK